MKMACETCHSTSSWTNIRFDHSKTTFPLFDKHAMADCQSCHNVEDFSRADANCLSCHQDVHQASMGGDCERCHTSGGWEVFDTEAIHENTVFPMMGQHNLVDCWQCHINAMAGDFALQSTDCISCHQQNYLDVENPNHIANAFSIECQDCHEMNGWRPAFLPDHDAFFPIFSGVHGGTWNDCSNCHDNSSSFSEFTCLSCHEHRQIGRAHV